jgi:molybdopterin/thiamine biosynthesis adenylyltransferase
MDSLNLESPLANIYNRQTGIKDFKESSAIVIGVGGIGSWIAMDLALIGIGTIIIIDPDKLESSNLNRTLFRLDQIGSLKTKAIKELISERRPDAIVLTIEDHFQTQLLEKYEVDYIFDATDNLASRQMIKELGESFNTPYCKCGYDGFQATISINEFDSGRWGDDGSYTVVPSFFGTPQILSAMAVIEMLIVDEDKSKTVNFNVKKLLNKINQQE